MIGKILKTMRRKKGLKQEEIAKTINVAISTLSGYESNYREPTFDVIESIANICGYDIIFRDRTTREELTSKNIERKEI